MEQISDTWIAAIQQWASNESLVQEAYIYGSRAKGVARPDSDLDIAIRLSGDTEEQRTENWIFEGEQLTSGLDSLLPITVHLEAIGEGDLVVQPAVLEHGILIFQRRK